MDSDGILLTGATGFLGMELLARYLERSERPVYALVRGRDAEQAAERLRAAARTVVPDADRHSHRLVAVRGDVTLPGLGLDTSRRNRLSERITEIVHAAASVSFNLPLRRARAINVEGTRRLLELAELCAARGRLRRFAHVSTAYVAGTHHGPFYEDDLERGQSFNNSYELSKWEAERLVRARSNRFPLTVFRPSIVVGEEESGWTPAFNVMYGPLKAFSAGSLTAVPGRRSAPVDVVPASYVADSIFELSRRADAAGRTYTLAAGPRASNVGELIDMAAAAFGRRRALAVPPALYKRAVHAWLMRRGSERRRRTLQRAEVYFPYFDARVRFDTTAAREALTPVGIRVPALSDYFDRLVRFAVTAKWGRRSLTRMDAVAAVGERAPRDLARPRLELVGV
jgi:thioester reductase-like protein